MGKKFSSTYQPNPENRGNNRLPADMTQANKLTKARLEAIINKYLWMSKDQLQEAVQGPDTPMIDIAIASIITKAIEGGCDKRLTFILDRLIGKVKEEIDIKTYMHGLQGLTEKQMVDLGQKAVNFLKET